MGWQVQAVDRVLASAALGTVVAVTPVLCFIRGDWPLLRPPDTYHGVRLEGTRSVCRLVTSQQVLDRTAIERLSRTLATAFPPK